MKSRPIRLLILCAGFVLAAGLLGVHSSKVLAVTGGSWQANRIIDDSVFFNPNTMGSQDIQTFLNSKVPVCDTNGTQTSELGGGTRAQYGIAHGNPPPYTCLKDYAQNVPTMPADAYCGTLNGGSMSAATIIKTVSLACGLNPEVLLVLLQKEQGLITDTWPFTIQYTAATGYGCPDTASCDPNFAGFFNQVYYGARQYQRYSKQAQLFNYASGQTAFVGYNPNSGCGGTNITMSNRSTAGLYNYTPYQPNQAALNNLYGTGDSCSAYGNRNFWRQFWDWFGNTTGPDYAWQPASFTFNSVMAMGQTQTVTLKATNTGRLPWYNQIAAPGTPTRIGTWDPGRGSPFAGGSWLNSVRPANLTENVVQPGQDGTFTFQLTAPNATGSYVEPFNILMENYLWLPWAGLSPTIQVVNPYQWQVNSVNYSTGTGYMAPGTTQSITVKALNTGSATWSNSGGSPIKLGTWDPGRQSGVAAGWSSSIRAATLAEASVAPGQVGTFTFNVYMPDSGQHYERLNLVAEGTSWFNDTGLTLYLQGQTYAWQPLWYSPSTSNWTMQRGTNFVLTIQAKNTGTATWYKSGSFPVRLGTDPPGRGSALYTPSWINGIRPVGLVQDSVPPGGEGTFTFNAVAPSSPGKRFEAFNLVAEGIAWFSDPGFGVNITSL